MQKILVVTIAIAIMIIGITVNVSADNSNIPRNNATIMSVDGSISSSLDSDNAERYYEITLASSGTLSLTLYNTDSTAKYETNYAMELLDESNRSWGVGLANEDGYSWALTKGTYYVAIYPWNDSPNLTETIYYTLESQFLSSYESSAFADGTDDTPEGARVIQPSTEYAGFLGDNDETDYYRVTIDRSSKVTVSILSGDMQKLNIKLLQIVDATSISTCHLNFTASGGEMPPAVKEVRMFSL